MKHRFLLEISKLFGYEHVRACVQRADQISRSATLGGIVLEIWPMKAKPGFWPLEITYGLDSKRSGSPLSD